MYILKYLFSSVFIILFSFTFKPLYWKLFSDTWLSKVLILKYPDNIKLKIVEILG